MTIQLQGNSDSVFSNNVVAPNIPTQGQIVGYQQGNWTPVISFVTTPGTPSYNSEGFWSRIGNQITLLVNFNISALNGGQGTLNINNLPYNAGVTITNSNLKGYGYVSYLGNSNGLTSFPSPVLQYSEQLISFYMLGSSQVSQNNISTGFSMRFALTYFTDDTTWTPINGATIS